jgi:hypothetical protein
LQSRPPSQPATTFAPEYVPEVKAVQIFVNAVHPPKISGSASQPPAAPKLLSVVGKETFFKFVQSLNASL